MRSGTICVGGGACDLSGRRVMNDACAMACRWVAVSTVTATSSSDVAHVTMHTAGAGNS